MRQKKYDNGMAPVVYLIGIGMGGPDQLTGQALDCLKNVQAVMGADRMLESVEELTQGRPILSAYRPSEMVKWLSSFSWNEAALVLSGDTGFYSGAETAGRAFAREGWDVEYIPGISSLSYFCAALGIPWQDAHVVSVHGRQADPVGAVRGHEMTFLLTGGATRAQDVCAALTRAGLGELDCAVGERLSYPDERIVTGPAHTLAGEGFDDLSVMLVINPAPVMRPWQAPGLRDGDFLRAEVPMTKEEIRWLAVCKLRLASHHVVWDVGAGTGSVSAECAQAVPQGQVYGVERDQEALELLAANRAKLGLSNLAIVPGKAPEALAELPTPDRVFIGGSGGALESVMRLALEKNPAVRFVITAITLETLTQATSLCRTLELADVEIVQVAVTRTRRVGRSHMAQGQNPVWIISGEGRP